jgi:nucleoside-diphosphate-sugar epimerase
VVRLPWVLGPHNYADREAFVLNRVLDQAEILLPGDGKALQQFVSSQQVAEAVVAVLEAASDGGWRAFNIATPGYLSLEGFVRICAAAAEVQPIFRSIGNGPTGTDSMVFDMNDCVFPFPNENYLLDLTASNEAHVAPTPITVDSIVEASLVALRADSGLRKWYRTAAERAHLQQAASQP